jgi:hypothetical protein
MLLSETKPDIREVVHDLIEIKEKLKVSRDQVYRQCITNPTGDFTRLEIAWLIELRNSLVNATEVIEGIADVAAKLQESILTRRSEAK